MTDERSMFPRRTSSGGRPKTRVRRVTGVAAIVWIASGASAFAGPRAPAPPPLYGAFLFVLFLLVLAASARSWRARAGRADLVSANGARTAATSEVADFARSLLDPDGAEQGIERFAAVLAHAVELEAAVLRLKSEAGPDVRFASTGGAAPPPSGDGGDPAAGGVRVAEEAEPYSDDYRWLPLVADGVELGRVGLRLPARRALRDHELALANLLCGQLALALRIKDYRARVQAQREEIEILRRRAESPVEILREEIQRPEKFADFVGRSESLRRALSLVERMAPSDVSILVTGETGTGKELVTRAVHALSRRCEGPLVTVNCPAIPGPLAESELFGHERGAFTDAVAARQGQFELADGGTIFLDEVADLPLDIQAKLLRVLQEGEVRRVGGHRARPVDVRTLAATNRDLVALVREGRFREDLYYRLAAVEVGLPPLRERHGDVPILASFFLEQAARAYAKEVTGFTASALAALSAYHWPGNVRQLHNVVHRAVLLCPGPAVGPAHLSEIAAGAGEARPASFGATMRQEKRRRFVEALHQAGWNQSAAARLLGMSRSNFARMLRTLEIAVPERGQGVPPGLTSTRRRRS